MDLDPAKIVQDVLQSGGRVQLSTLLAAAVPAG